MVADVDDFARDAMPVLLLNGMTVTIPRDMVGSLLRAAPRFALPTCRQDHYGKPRPLIEPTSTKGCPMGSPPWNEARSRLLVAVARVAEIL